MSAGPRSTAAVLLALSLGAGCTPAGPAPGRRPPDAPAAPPAAGLPAAEPVVRVGVVVDSAGVTVGADAAFELAAEGAVLRRSEAGASWRVEPDAAGVVATGPAGERVGPVAALEVRPAGDRPVRISGRPYRGRALVVPSRGRAGRLDVVNVVDLEAYLLGVVPAEIPSLALEAVKAQAVAARTYAVGNLGGRASRGFDFYATVQDQVYGGVAREDTMAARAVRETRGEIVAHDGVPILAYYHSTCGGRTAAIDQVWRRAPLPYLRSVSDARPSGGHYCDASNRFDWREEWEGAELADVLVRTLARHFDRATEVFRPIRGLEVVDRTPSGRVGTLRIEAGDDAWTLRGDSIRWILRPDGPDGRILNSVLFDLEQRTEGGRVTALRVDGHGWGHGIGMCQMGAIGRARDGQDYRRILAAYYTGTEVRRLYR